MEGNSFWLIYIQDESVSVSLISTIDNLYKVLSIGPQKKWDINNNDSLITAVDESLSVACLNANITEDQEPETAAFVVPPFWVGNDGKISSTKIKLIKETCKKLTLNPSGFLAEDESLVEEANLSDGFPASFIVLHLSSQEFYLSLVYLGHVKERIKKSFTGEFTGQMLESALLELNSESALPPQIIIFGQADEAILSSLKNYPWVGKKNIETFLHFPEIKLYSENEIINIFTKVIFSQFSPNLKLKNSIDEEILIENNDAEESNDSPKEILVQESTLIETDPQDLGFLSSDALDKTLESVLPIVDAIPEPKFDSFKSPVLPPLIVSTKKQKINLSFLKKLKFPHPKFSNNFIWISLIILPFLLLAPFFLVTSQITLSLNPYQFSKSIPATLKVDGSIEDISKSIIPVKKESFEIEAKATVETTGQKTVGQKAQGEIIIYNKVGSPQSIPKGAILTDSSGKKFELTTAVSIPPSNSDLDKGVITLGQTKTVALAVDIGSEYNIPADSQLIFKDFADTLLIAKNDNPFTGGSRQQIKAVSLQDKTNIQSKIDETITKNIENKINNDLGNITGVIKETIQSKKNNLELSREIGEEADELVGTITASVTVYTLIPEVKNNIIKYFLSSEPNFDKIEFNSDDFKISFELKKIDSSKATGNITISGLALPIIDKLKVQKSLVAQTNTNSENIIRKLIPRAYNFLINNKLPLLPFRSENINIEVKPQIL